MKLPKDRVLHSEDKMLQSKNLFSFKLFTIDNKGFTLIELMVAIAIVAILAVIGMTVFSGTQKSARDTRRRGDIDSISKTLEANYNTYQNQNCAGSSAGTYCNPLAAWFQGNVVPTDPQTGAAYAASPALANNNSSYCVCAVLENKNGNSSTLCTGGTPTTAASFTSASGSLATHYCVRSQQ